MARLKSYIFLLVTFYLTLFSSYLFACFTILVGKDATVNKVALIARSSDTKDARRSKLLKVYYKNHLHKLYIGLPYWDLEADPTYDMPQVTTNRYGVSISATETIQSNQLALSLDPPSFAGRGVSEPNIPAIVMPDATSAIDAVKILGKAIEERGVNDSWGFGVLFSDKTETWYLETLSTHQWVAIRIPDDVYFVAANGPQQIQEYLPTKYTYLMSFYQVKSPIDFAHEHQFANLKNGVFDFRATYGDIYAANNNTSNYIRIAYAQHLLNPATMPFNEDAINKGTYPMFLKPENPISIEDIKAIQSSHYAEYPQYDPYIWSYKDTDNHPFYYPITVMRTSNAHVTEVREPLDQVDSSISNVQYIALGMPLISVYLPIYYGINKVPTSLTKASNIADDFSLFWQFRKIQTLVFLHDPAKNIPYEFNARLQYVKQKYQTLDNYLKNKQNTMEKIYKIVRNTALIDQFTQEAADQIQEVNQQIINHFLTELNIDALYKLTNNAERNTWFTNTLREQDCFYRINKCNPKEKYFMQTLRDKYVDEPV
ncbi:MAG: hypothetical protein A3F18_05825 [Legionellales bacterium RIFCSPHIGHO2_12_FULL_37_14]|nr:MAG: hypothetical protein A3F18_05825 [Legionellales bacterium RIFCSPHIGHO2_12_FULL_37_14]